MQKTLQSGWGEMTCYNDGQDIRHVNCSNNSMIKLKRAYDLAQKKDGYRVLIDRLWPRGIKKSALIIDAWMKELAPSTKLRKSFGHDPNKWSAFRREYLSELRSAFAQEKLDRLAKLGKKRTITLVYSAKDEEHNDAIVLKATLDRKIRKLND